MTRTTLKSRKCDKCPQRIAFITSTSGKQVPVDLPPRKVVTADGEVIDGYTPHFQTCPHAAAFRRSFSSGCRASSETDG